MTNPTVVQSAGNSSGNSTSTVTVTLPGAATAGNLIVVGLAGDKNTGTVSFTDSVNTSGSNWATDVSKTGASVSMYAGSKPAAGGETTVTCTVGTTAASGLTAWVAELAQDGTGAWALQALISPTYSDTAVSSISLGTTSPSAPVDALGVAYVGIDSSSNRTSGPTWTGATGLYTTAGTPVGHRRWRGRHPHRHHPDQLGRHRDDLDALHGHRRPALGHGAGLRPGRVRRWGRQRVGDPGPGGRLGQWRERRDPGLCHDAGRRHLLHGGAQQARHRHPRHPVRFTLVSSVTGGSGTQGPDAGSTRITVYLRNRVLGEGGAVRAGRQ